MVQNAPISAIIADGIIITREVETWEQDGNYSRVYSSKNDLISHDFFFYPCKGEANTCNCKICKETDLKFWRAK